MAVSINNVYQKVLAIANKEQRGYITPQEFNLFANQAQMDIFEQYFYDLNQFSRVSGNDTAHADSIALLNEKIDHFDPICTAGPYNTISGVLGGCNLPGTASFCGPRFPNGPIWAPMNSGVHMDPLRVHVEAEGRQMGVWGLGPQE